MLGRTGRHSAAISRTTREEDSKNLPNAQGRHPAETEGVQLKSRVVKRSIVIGGHRTSVSLEDAFWDGLKEIARQRAEHLSDIVCNIDVQRQHCNLSSAIRLYVFEYFHK